jgi:transposase
MIHRWLARHPRFHLHFTPISSSWLNPVERRFALLTDKETNISSAGRIGARGRSKTAILACIALNNTAPKPFVWTKTANEILANVA